MVVAIKQRWSDASRRKKGLVVGGTVVAAALIAGGAYALWSATGEGEGRATATEAVTVEVVATNGTPDLYPGFTEGDLYFTLVNDNPYPVTFTSGTSDGTVDTGPAPGCDGTNITVPLTFAGLDLEVAADSTSGLLSIPDVVTMIAAAPDACQGVSFDVQLTLNGTQTTP